MKYTIYKTTNGINGKIYIGKHQAKNPYDNYIGSGIAIKKAVKKYGRKNFTKEVLFIFDTEQEMNDKEKELVNELFISTNKTYNIALGGEGSAHFSGLKHSKEAKEKCRISALKRTTVTRMMGASNGRSKLNKNDVIEIRKLLCIGKSLNKIACLFNISKTAVLKIKQGKTWKSI